PIIRPPTPGTFSPGEKVGSVATEMRGLGHVRAEESLPAGTPLLRLVMKQGKRTAPATTADEARLYARQQLARLPKEYQALEGAPKYPVMESAALRELAERVRGSVVSGSEEATSQRSLLDVQSLD
ncbi:MAG: hypothetical protein ACRD2B_07755, partial [Terriglobia bacterium]